MLELAARFGDAWNWWSGNESVEDAKERLGPIVAQLDAACEGHDRDPTTLERTLDLYTVVPEEFAEEAEDAGLPMDQLVGGSTDQVAEHILAFADLGFSEVRCDVWPKSPAAIEAMGPVVEAVHDE